MLVLLLLAGGGATVLSKTASPLKTIADIFLAHPGNASISFLITNGTPSAYDLFIKDHNASLKSRGVSLDVRSPAYIKATREVRASMAPEEWNAYVARAQALKAALPTVALPDTVTTVGMNVSPPADVDLSLLPATRPSEPRNALDVAMVNAWPMDRDRLHEFTANRTGASISDAFRRRHCQLGIASTRKSTPWPREQADVARALNDRVAKLRSLTFNAVRKLVYDGGFLL